MHYTAPRFQIQALRPQTLSTLTLGTHKTYLEILLKKFAPLCYGPAENQPPQPVDM